MKKIINLYIPLFVIILFSLFILYHYDISYFYKQIIWISLGFGLLFCSKFIKANKLFKYSKFMYILNLFLLLLVLFVGKEINGSRAWFSFKFFSFQPSEVMKLSMALYLANIFKEKHKHYFIKSLLIFIIPSVLVFLEPDTGAIVMYLVIYLASLFFSLKNKKLFYLFCFISCLLLIIFIYLYFSNINLLTKLLGTSIFYRIDRILNFKDNYQLENALISLGTTGFIGRNNKPMLYIPESVTDFIFDRMIANFGFISGIIIIICYFLILIFLIQKIDKSKQGIVSFSFFWLFLFQLIQNIFMNLGLVPIMGIPLPFLSYGGSNTIIYFLFLSLILSKEKSKT